MTILQNTLTGTLPSLPQALQVPDTSGDLSQDIKTLSSAQQQPSAILNLQKAMQNASSVAYKERQASELTQAGKQFDPTKVSGGTFASIIGNLEANRGADVSKIYASTMQTYRDVQNEITRRLEIMRDEEESKRRWEEEMKFRKKELERLKKNDKRAYKMEKEKFEMDKKSWELSYKKALQGSGGGSGNDYFQSLTDSFGTITVGEDSYLDPAEFSAFSKDALENATNAKDLSTLKTFIDEAKNYLNPKDRDDEEEKDDREP